MKKILAIDDQEENLYFVEEVINQYLTETKVILCKTGTEGINVAKKELPDVILLDLMMPEMDGFQTCSNLKSDLKTKHIPVIIISGIMTDSSSKIKALELGADAFLTKPIGPAELIAQIKAMIRIKIAEDKLRKENIKLNKSVKKGIKKFNFALDKYQKILDNDFSGILETTLEGKIISFNTALLNIIGYKDPSEINSYNVLDFYKDKANRDQILNMLKKDKKVSNYCVDILDKNGETLNLLLNLIISEENTILTFITDITTLKKTEAKLIKANKIKDGFIANMSHEIRTPLNGILGMTNLIKETFQDQMDEMDKVLFDGVESASKRLTRTVDMILNFSLLQVGDLKAEKEKVDILKICKDLVNEFNITAKNKSLVLSLESKITDATILADFYKINEAIANLIDNAIKYTNEGFVKLKIYSNQENELLLDISDSGVGIDKDKIEFIFQPFMQEEMGYSRTFEGVGLGLSIVKQYLELNNFTISVSSKKNVGTIFTINFGKKEM